MIKVEFLGGELRDGSQGNYMRAVVDDGLELYSEITFIEDKESFDEYSYSILKDNIIKQAKENGVGIESLYFWWG